MPPRIIAGEGQLWKRPLSTLRQVRSEHDHSRVTAQATTHSTWLLCPNRAIKNPGVSRRNLEANCGARRFLHVTSWPRESCIASSSALAEGLVSLQRAGEGRSTVAAGRVWVFGLGHSPKHWRSDGHGQERCGTGKESCSEEHEKTRKAVRLAVSQCSMWSVIREKVLDSIAAEAKPANFAIIVESVCGGGAFGGGAFGGCRRSIVCNEL